MIDIKSEIKEFIKSIRSKTKVGKYIYNNSLEENPNKVFYSGPYWDDEEIAAVIETILTGKWLSSGENVHKFESAFCKKLNQDYAVMVNSGSSANLVLITAAKKYFEWNDDDEIIVSPVGFPTTIAPIVQNNLKPAFVDIEWATLNFDLHKLESKINEKSKAIFLSPVLGNPCNISKLLDICRKHNLILLLDSCDSLGSKWEYNYLNEYAFASSFSFYPAHHITTAEGGMVTSNDEEFIDLCRSISWWGRACYCVGSANLLPNGTCGCRFDKWLPNYDGEIDHKYIFDNIGYNLKPLDLQGAIGLVQLSKMDEIDVKRKYNKYQIQKILQEELEDYCYIPSSYHEADTSWFGVPIVMKNYMAHGVILLDEKGNRQSLVKHLEAAGIQTRPYFAGNILMHPGYEHLDDFKKYPEANKVLDRVFFLGCHPSYTEGVFDHIRKTVIEWREKNS